MPTREGRIRVTFEKGSIRSSLRDMTRAASAEGHKMARALSGPMTAGFSNVKKSIAGMFSDLKGHIKTALTFGGAFGAGALVKDAMEAQTAYLQLADAMTMYTGQAHEAAQVQKMITEAADETKVPIGELRRQMMQLVSAAGKVDIEQLLERAAKQARRLAVDGEFVSRVYTRLVAKGVAKTAEEAENLTEQMNTLFRKMLGVDLDEAIDPNDVAELAGFVNTTGNSFEEMLKVIAMGGKDIAKDFGKANELVEELGLSLKQTKGIDEMTKKLKLPKGAIDANKSAIENMLSVADMGPKKFAAMADALSGDVAGAALKQMMGGEEFMAAAKRGKVTAKEWDLRVAKLRRELEDLSDIAVDRKKMEEADARHKASAAAQLDHALNKVRDAFTKPEMIKSINTLADKLPVFAEKLVDLISWVTDNPWKAAGIAAGAKVGGAFLTGAVGKGIGGALLGGGGTAAAGGGAAGGAAGGTAAGLAAAGAGVVAAGAAGVGAGMLANKYVFDPQNMRYADFISQAESFSGKGGGSLQKNIEKMRRLNQTRIGLQLTKYNTENIFGQVGSGMLLGGIGSMVTGTDTPMQRHEKALESLAKAAEELSATIMKQKAEQDTLIRSTENAGRAIQKAFPNTPSGASRGTSSLDNTPGHKPVRG